MVNVEVTAAAKMVGEVGQVLGTQEDVLNEHAGRECYTHAFVPH
jgi:hypothetical protein